MYRGGLLIEDIYWLELIDEIFGYNAGRGFFYGKFHWKCGIQDYLLYEDLYDW